MAYQSGGPRSVVAISHYNSKGQVDYVQDGATNKTWFAYDETTGQRVAVTNSLGDGTYTAFDVQGRQLATWGATYPVAYSKKGDE